VVNPACLRKDRREAVIAGESRTTGAGTAIMDCFDEPEGWLRR
jgi:hypothetical protein